tara:strand:+ start:636 stop:1013 length:378 start_codon:yes stop_codon:yes gene_type:complete
MATKKFKVKKTPFYRTVKWITGVWAILGTCAIIYAYTLLWDFKQYAETLNDFNQVQLSWEKPNIETLESWTMVVDYCIDEICGRMQGATIYKTEAICATERDEIVADTMDMGGVWAYRCVEKQGI